MKLITDKLATGDIGDLTPEGWIVVDVRDLSDFETNEGKIEQKLLFIVHLLTMGAKVCVRCVCGINRSNTMALATLCFTCNKNEYLDTDWDRHYNFMKKKVPQMLLELDLVNTTKKVLKKMWKGWK